MQQRARVVQIPLGIYERLKHLAPTVSEYLLNDFYKDIQAEPVVYTVSGQIVPDVHGYLLCVHHVTNLLMEFEME